MNPTTTSTTATAQSRMFGGFIKIGPCLAILTMTGALQAQWLHQPTPGIPRTRDGKPDLTAPPPKTAVGKPDLSGIWTMTKTDGGISQLKPSEIKPWALKLFKEREEAVFKDSPRVHCLPSGFVAVVGYDLSKIVQTPDLIVMLGEDLTYRQIFLDGRGLPKEPNPAWIGYSVGRWEGETLVVESTGYTDRTWLENGYPHTEGMRITERFHRGDFGHLTVDATYSDPEAYEKSWTAKTEMQYVADTELLEYVCAENEKDSIHLVGKKSDETKNAVRLSPEVLSKYVGSYGLQLPGGRPVEFKVAVEDGELTVSAPGASRRQMTALSETVFVSDGIRFEFGKNDTDEVTHLVIHAAEGDVHADRKK